MKILRYDNDENKYHCFSVSNNFLTRRGAVRVLKKIPNIEILTEPKWFDGEVFCKFKINGVSISIDEPWGDSSQFDIYCETPNTNELKVVEIAFKKHRYDLISVIQMVSLILLGLPFLIMGLAGLWLNITS